MSEEIERLSRLFTKLGARDPEDWASSQINEGIPQLARFLFLRQAWRAIVSESDDSWIDANIRAYRDDSRAPFSGVGRALEALRTKGATSTELTDLVRGMQAELLSGLCYLLEDPGDLEEEVSHVAWGLFLLDENDQPIEMIGGLQESVLETDPTGREMRPRGD
jgi:hypothetical protein